jgi:hypothetical protein
MVRGIAAPTFDYEALDYEALDYEALDYEALDYEALDYEALDYEALRVSRSRMVSVTASAGSTASTVTRIPRCS